MSFGGRAAKLSALFNDDDDFDGGGLFGNVAKDEGGDPFKYQRPAAPLKPKPKPKPKPIIYLFYFSKTIQLVLPHKY